MTENAEVFLRTNVSYFLSLPVCSCLYGKWASVSLLFCISSLPWKQELRRRDYVPKTKKIT